MPHAVCLRLLEWFACPFVESFVGAANSLCAPSQERRVLDD